jgi:hypothetical protein
LKKDCPKKEEKPESNAISLLPENSPESNAISVPAKRHPSVNSVKDRRSYSDVVSGKWEHTVSQNPNVPTISIIQKSEDGSKTEREKPPPMITTIPIEGVPVKTLIDSGSSDDFLGSHFATINRISVHKRETPLSIQQAVKGSKPKTNAITSVKAKFGEWTKTLKAHVAGLAGYDAIIGVPTLDEGDVVIDVHNRKVHLRAWNVTLDCTIAKEPSNPLKKQRREVKKRRSMA